MLLKNNAEKQNLICRFHNLTYRFHIAAITFLCRQRFKQNAMEFLLGLI